MTPLPQRKKTAEEIAQLREELGVPKATPATTKMETVMEPASEEQRKATTAGPDLETEELKTPDFKKLIHSNPDQAAPAELPDDLDSPIEESASGELEASEVHIGTEGGPDSPLPERRRSPEELEELRRREMLSHVGQEPPVNYKFQPAHPALITFGYLLAAVGSCRFWIKNYPWTALAAGCTGALLVATFLFICRPASRHHAGFISATAGLVGFFTIIHQIQNAP